MVSPKSQFSLQLQSQTSMYYVKEPSRKTYADSSSSLALLTPNSLIPFLSCSQQASKHQFPPLSQHLICHHFSSVPFENLLWMSPPLLSFSLTLISSQLHDKSQRLQICPPGLVLHFFTPILLPESSFWRAQVLALLCSELLTGSHCLQRMDLKTLCQLILPDLFSLFIFHSLSNTLHFNQLNLPVP